MSTYTAGGKGHRMLARLEAGPATRTELKDAVDPHAYGKARRRLMRVADALRQDDLACFEPPARLAITPLGAQVLAELDRRGTEAVKVDGSAIRSFERAA